MPGSPRHGTVLRCEEGSAVVIEPGASPLGALLTLLEAEYGGERFSETNPAVVERAADVRIQTWRSYLKAQREAEGLDDFEDYWGPDGQGRRSVAVAYFDDDIYALGVEAAKSDQGA